MLQHDAELVLKALVKELKRLEKQTGTFNTGYNEGLAKAGFIILDQVMKQLPPWAQPYHDTFIRVVD